MQVWYLFELEVKLVSSIGVSYNDIVSRKVSGVSQKCVLCVCSFICGYCSVVVIVVGMSISSVSIFMFLVIMLMLVKNQFSYYQCQFGFSKRWCSRLQLVRVMNSSSSGLICVFFVWKVNCSVNSSVQLVYNFICCVYRCCFRLIMYYSVFSVVSSDGSRKVMCYCLIRLYSVVCYYISIGGLFEYSLVL